MKTQPSKVQTFPGPSPLEYVPIRNLTRLVRRIRQEIARRAYELWEQRGREHGRDQDDWFQAEEELTVHVQTEIRDANGVISVYAPVPGFSASELAVSVESRRLTILGWRDIETRRKSAAASPAGPRAKKLLCVVDLPAAVDPLRIRAAVREGKIGVAMTKADRSAEIRAALRASKVA